MPTVECLITHTGQVLLVRRPEDKTQPGMLLPVGGHVEAGESPLEACLREVREETGLTVTPSCVAVVFSGAAETTGEYKLTFVAEAASELVTPSAASALEWVAVESLTEREDVPALDRELIPRVLASSSPLAIVLDVDATTEPYTRKLVSVSAIDPARLSPLVFAVTP
jgi:ADP-ribose pyrophosphatase YjhB (NUDIX family)